ncbi:MAG: SixA phosphatase family protein [Gaiellaceae bacterium]
MRLVLVRHAEAAPGEPDELRTLTPEGHEQARALGERLRSDGIEPDAVLSSPLLRARETAADLGFGEPEPLDELAPGATADRVRTAVRGRGETVIVVGHQPDCGQITAALRGGAEPAFPAAGVQIIEL